MIFQDVRRFQKLIFRNVSRFQDSSNNLRIIKNIKMVPNIFQTYFRFTRIYRISSKRYQDLKDVIKIPPCRCSVFVGTIVKAHCLTLSSEKFKRRLSGFVDTRPLAKRKQSSRMLRYIAIIFAKCCCIILVSFRSISTTNKGSKVPDLLEIRKFPKLLKIILEAVPNHS